MQDSNPSKTPAENNLRLVKATDSKTLVDERLYRSLVGSLLYIAKQTRPDIVWIVNKISRFMDKPTNTHWLAFKRVLRYLQATKSLKLVYSRDSDFNIHGENDADWSGDHDDRRSTTGYFFKLGLSGAVSWQTKKQQTVELSSCEAEYQVLAAAVQEATFLRSLLCEMGSEQSQPTIIGEDNQSVIKLETNPVMHKRSKYFDSKFHFIREKTDDNLNQLVYTPTDQQLAADLLTKALPQVKVEQHRKQHLG